MATQENQYLTWIIEHWYIFLIAIGLIVLIILLSKGKKKREYYSEINRHKEIVNNEMKFNPSDYKYLVIKNLKGTKILGEIVGYRTDNYNVKYLTRDKESPRMKELNAILNEILPVEKKEELFNMITVSVLTKKIGLFGIDFFFSGKEIFTMPKSFVRLDDVNSQVICDEDINFIYRDGRYVSGKNQVAIIYTENELIRTIHDHSVDAMGYQALRLTEVKDEYAQQINLKEKDAEIEEKKRKTLLER